MVCRENKGRSAVMGAVKAEQLAYGDAFSDAEIQSLQHEINHEVDALNTEELTTEEQVEFWRRYRSVIERNQNISEAKKYSKSSQRPGIVTRIDQEIKRLESGTHENGQPLTNAQRNNMAQMYSSMRFSEEMERRQPAKAQYLEVYARHTGKSYDEAKARYKQLFDEQPPTPGAWVAKSHVGNTYRTELEAAGIDAQTQMNLGTSGRNIHAMEVMEKERHEALAAAEKKPMANPDNLVASSQDPNSPNGRKQCKTSGSKMGCGQFGHELPDCPNRAEVEELQRARAYRRQNDKVLKLRDRANDAENLTDERIRSKYKAEDAEVWRDQARSEFAQAQANGAFATAEKQAAKLRRKEETAQKKLDSNAAIFHEEVSDVYYNDQAGVLIVNRRPGEDGKVPPSVIRRCNETQAQDFVQSIREKQPLHTALEQHAGEEHNRFANTADMQAAETLTRCPSCGQWASMNTSHECTISGGPSEEREQERMRARVQERQNRRIRERGGDPDREAAMVGNGTYAPRQVFTSRSSDSPKILVDEQKRPVAKLLYRRAPRTDEVKQALDSGDVALAPLQYSYTDGKVTGKISVWREEVKDKDGNIHARNLMSRHNTGHEGSGLKCDCAEYARKYYCRHMHETMKIMKNTYSAEATQPNVVPGEGAHVTNSSNDRIAPDMLVMDSKPTDYNRLVELRETRLQKNIDEMRLFRAEGEGATTLMVSPTVDSDGKIVEPPTHWSPQEFNDAGTVRPQGTRASATTDLDDKSAVTQRMRQMLNNMSVTMPDGSTENIRPRVNSRDRPGGLSIGLPKTMDKAAPSVRAAAIRGIADRMGVPATAFRNGGLFIPANRGSYAEHLDRAAGNAQTRRWTGPQTHAFRDPDVEAATRRGAVHV